MPIGVLSSYYEKDFCFFIGSSIHVGTGYFVQ